MQLHDTISSYKCFEAIATPSPIPIDFNRNLSSALRSTSLDSLANSSEQDSLSDDQSIGGDIGPLSDDHTDINHPSNHHHHPHHQYQAHPHRKSDLDAFKLSEISANESREPIIKEFLEKSHRKCDYKNCGYKNSEQQTFPEHTIDECATSATAQYNLGQQQQQKTRRTSIASSGSVGRMETIIEEPIEPKISVKEILARFETLTSLEVNSKYQIHTYTIRNAAERKTANRNLISIRFYFILLWACVSHSRNTARKCIHAFRALLIPFFERIIVRTSPETHSPIRNPIIYIKLFILFSFFQTAIYCRTQSPFTHAHHLLNRLFSFSFFFYFLCKLIIAGAIESIDDIVWRTSRCTNTERTNRTTGGPGSFEQQWQTIAHESKSN